MGHTEQDDSGSRTPGKVECTTKGRGPRNEDQGNTMQDGDSPYAGVASKTWEISLLVKVVWPYIVGISVVVGLIVGGERIVNLIKPTPPEGFLIGLSKEQIRLKNGVREMLPAEDGVSLSRVRGVFGFLDASALIFLNIPPSRRPDLKLAHQSRPLFGDSWEKFITQDTLTSLRQLFISDLWEVHITQDKKIMLLFYLSESAVSRLGSLSGKERVFVYPSPRDEYRHLVGIPLSRIRGWDGNLLKRIEVTVE